MTDKENPEGKPSFFDSFDEAISWPPSEEYELEETQAATAADKVVVPKKEILKELGKVNYEPDALDELLSSDKDFESSSKIDTPEYVVNLLMNDFSGSFDGQEEASGSYAEEDFLIPKNQALESNTDKKVDEKSYVSKQSSEKVNILDKGKIKIVDDDDTLSDIFNNNPEKPLQKEKKIKEDYSNLEVNNDDFDLEDYVQGKTAKPKDYTNNSTSSVSDLVDVYLEEEIKPFRTYASLNYSEEHPEEVVEEKSSIMSGINRNVIILALLIVGILFYLLFNNLFKPKYDVTGRKRDPRPTKQKRVAVESKELVPLWEVSAQKARSEVSERQLVQTIYKTSGRDNPFALPESILADLRKTAKAELAKKMKPNTYRRLAYRATLVGVLTANDNTIALVNQQEASFDVLEGTTKSKILGLATKAMDKAKRDTQEMVVGSYIGPWVITRIESPDSIFSDAKVHIQLNGDKKILNMGKAEELGIFTEEGQLDDLENPIGSLDEDLDFDF
jgi:hypothetical protein